MNNKLPLAIFLFGIILLEMGCLSRNVSIPTSDKSLVGSWRFYPQRTNDQGMIDLPTSRKLELRSDGSWEFGSSRGSWGTKDITAADWAKWKIESYGPKKKIVLNGWSGQTVDGPIEEVEARVDFFWLIYDVGPPVTTRVRQAQLRFGH